MESQFSTSLRSAAWMALGSAVLFGISTPVAKLLLQGGISPQLLAGVFYLGSGVGLGLLRLLPRPSHAPTAEAPLRRADLPWLIGAVLLGGALGPALLLLGLSHTAASTAALLLNLEGIATMCIAWIVYHEHVDRPILLGAVAIAAGAVVLSWQGWGPTPSTGALWIVLACLCWGADNNLTRKLSSADPVQITLIKGLVAGSVNLGLALAMGARLPAWGTLASAALVGFFGYGLSLVWFVRALRHLGAARTAAYFSTAPFIGALLAVMLFSEPISLRLLLAGVLMGVGVYLHLRESHEHEHRHEALDHEHRHVHDEHHQHPHRGDEGPEPHSHRHHHVPLVHRHPHYPDLHHRHSHRPEPSAPQA